MPRPRASRGGLRRHSTCPQVKALLGAGSSGPGANLRASTAVDGRIGRRSDSRPDPAFFAPGNRPSWDRRGDWIHRATTARTNHGNAGKRQGCRRFGKQTRGGWPPPRAGRERRTRAPSGHSAGQTAPRQRGRRRCRQGIPENRHSNRRWSRNAIPSRSNPSDRRRRTAPWRRRRRTKNTGRARPKAEFTCLQRLLRRQR